MVLRSSVAFLLISENVRSRPCFIGNPMPVTRSRLFSLVIAGLKLSTGISHRPCVSGSRTRLYLAVLLSSLAAGESS